jgi:Baseplate J-like protein
VIDDPLVTADDERRLTVAAPGSTVNGIDYLEVDGTDRRVLLVHFFHPLPGQTGGVPATGELTRENVRIEGGTRITDIAVLDATAAEDVLTVTAEQVGDFSPYLLRLVSGLEEDATPDGFDPWLAHVPFSFRVDCPAPGDCRPAAPGTAPTGPQPLLDYLVKDYEGFRRLMLDRLGTLLPDWTERNPADPVVALVEALAHTADLISYEQDAVGTEATLGTARSRISLRRHARLLDYRVHDGCNARAWLSVEVGAGTAADGARLLADTAVLGPEPDPVVFQTAYEIRPTAARSSIPVHAWGSADAVLPAGATAATLVDDPKTALAVGDVVILEEAVDPASGLAAAADPRQRQAVRLVAVEPGHDPVEDLDVLQVRWHQADALARPLRVAARPVPGQPPVAVAVARGNVVLADHGVRVVATLPAVDGPRYRPVLSAGPLTFAEPFDPVAARARPAAEMARRDARAALPAITLADDVAVWEPRRDLLASDGFDPGFVVETERDGATRLRFGDDTHGRAPTAGTVFAATFRVGTGTGGNVGHDVLTRLDWPVDGVTGVTNPLPATGGTRAESMEEIRQYAPEAYRTQQRAVTEADWVAAALRHPQVQAAGARVRWTGSWYTVYVIVDRLGGASVTGDPEFAADLRRHLSTFRLAGYDLEIAGPVEVPLDVALSARAAPEAFRADVERALRNALGSGTRADGGRGFFHPDNFTFAQPLFVSELERAAMAVPGVESVRVTRLQRYGQAAAGEVASGVLAVADLEVIRLDDDPNFAEHGSLEITVDGGL